MSTSTPAPVADSPATPNWSPDDPSAFVPKAEAMAEGWRLLAVGRADLARAFARRLLADGSTDAAVRVEAEALIARTNLEPSVRWTLLTVGLIVLGLNLFFFAR